MEVIDKTIINNFAQGVEAEAAQNALIISSNLITTALNHLATINPHISKYTLVPVGDFFTGSVLPSSIIDFLIVLEDPEVELNTRQLFKNKWKLFKSRFKYAWQNRKKRKKTKKQKNKKEEDLAIHKDNYNLEYFAKDLMFTLAQHITTDDLVQVSKGVIWVHGQNLPFKIRLFPVIQKEEKKYQFYRPNKKHLIEFDLNEYEENIHKLLDAYGIRFIEQVQILKGLFTHLTGNMPNSIFIESLVANMTDSAFEHENAFENFVFVANYLINCKTSKLFSIANPETKIFEDKLCQTSLYEINTFFSKLLNSMK